MYGIVIKHLNSRGLGLLTMKVPFVRMASQTEKNYFQINPAFRSRCRHSVAPAAKRGQRIANRNYL